MNVAIGGPNDIISFWTGEIIDALKDMKHRGTFNIAHGSTTLDITDTRRDQIHFGSTADNQPSWSTENATKRADKIRESNRQLLLALTPSHDNDYLDILLEPITHMVIITEKQESPEFNRWKNIADRKEITVTHHLIINEDTGKVYWTNDEGVVKIRVYYPGPEMPEKHMYRKLKSKGIAELATDLAEIALDFKRDEN